MRKSLKIAGAASACVLTGAVLYGSGAASADGGANPTHSTEPYNIGKLVGEIDDYYGAEQDDDGTWTSSPDSDYAKDLARVQHEAKKDIRQATQHGKHHRHGKPALVLDIDDTSLLSFDYERSTNYTFDEETWNEYVSKADRPAVFGMPELVEYAKKRGVEIFFLTGLSEDLRKPAVKNLEKVGFDTKLDKSHVFTKDKANPPSYLDHCATPAKWECSTVEYKAGTREHLEDKGFHIVGNFGDQQSDLDGGHAKKGYKLPNPTYFVE
ncbi:HAD family acid phosphatase [Streptomyces sp. NPDC005438]|uniref:HAD family acid phosphatase n=1 Tax=Streptomyces sp. NPDC005438 TaxID=3156880 RepID=UPI0033AFD430